MEAKRSPLKQKPRRQAGQSVQDQMLNLVSDKLFAYILISTISIVVAALEWWRFLLHAQPHPIPLTVIAALILLYCGIGIWRVKVQMRHYKQGRDGERVVGEFLERLREDGNIVFHDILGEGFNIDHVVLSTKGIYLIETKTYSKPVTGEAKVHFDGKSIRIDGLGDQSRILKQVDAGSTWLRRLLLESTGRDFNVHPVVLFPGWYIESRDHSHYWLLEPKALPRFIRNQREILSLEDMKLAAYHLSRYIRSI